MVTYKVSDWNIHAYTTDRESTLINRTNNPLERFNRELNKKFPSAHPSMIEFVNVIREISNEYVAKVEKVKKGRYILPTHAPVRYEEVPEDYHSFCVPHVHMYMEEPRNKAEEIHFLKLYQYIITNFAYI